MTNKEIQGDICSLEPSCCDNGQIGGGRCTCNCANQSRCLDKKELGEVRLAENYESDRLGWVDAVKGLGIVLVILGHTHALFRSYIFSFHMPLFFFISGVLHRNRNETPQEFIAKRFRVFLIPYIFFSLVSILLNSFVTNGELDLLQSVIEMFVAKRNSISYNPTLWYFPCIFLTEMLFYIISKIIKKSWVRVVCILTISIVGYISSFNVIFPYSANLAMYYLAFFALGHSMKNILDRRILEVLFKFCLFLSFILFVKPSYYAVLGNL